MDQSIGINVVIFILLLTGGLLYSGFSFPSVHFRKIMKDGAERLQQRRTKKALTAKEYVARIDGKQKESLMVRSRREARQVYEKTGQSKRYGKTLKLSMLTGAGGTLAGLLIFRNPLLALVLAMGGYFLPLWTSQFSQYRYDKFLNEELETALSLITTSYTRGNDILAAVKENLPHINDPVRSVFDAFCANLEYVDPNAPAQIERMKTVIDNKLFWQWCDNLILCQDDHTLRASLLPIVSKFSDLKTQQMENATNMMLPLKKILSMIVFAMAPIPLFYILNIEWYNNLVNTMLGQLSLVTMAVCVLVSINKAIRVSKPIEYDV